MRRLFDKLYDWYKSQTEYDWQQRKRDRAKWEAERPQREALGRRLALEQDAEIDEDTRASHHNDDHMPGDCQECGAA